MDLRKAIFLKKPLNSSVNSLNSSNLSVYESAAEDSDRDDSIYYSFSKENSNENDLFDADNSLISETSEADKENTVIMVDVSQESIENHHLKVEVCEKNTSQAVTEMKEEQIQSSNNDEKTIKRNMIVADKTPVKINRDENVLIKTPKSEETETVMESTETYPKLEEELNKIAIPEIIIEDPNENVINPFTSFFGASSTSNQNQSEIVLPTEAAKSKPDLKRKFTSKIPTKSPFYSPVQRKSIDKRVKLNVKLPLELPKRRTLYETRSQVKVNEKPKIPSSRIKSQPTVTTKQVIAKTSLTRVHKCTFTGCNQSFNTLKNLQDHLKSHASTSSSSSSSTSVSTFKCKWCDKTFELPNALLNHQLERCSKIPYLEKRKLLAQQEKQEKPSDKRKSMFMAPQVPKKRSPSRRQTLNKSGVTITPKKSLKCHVENCGKIFTDVLDFANHTVAHKYENTIKSHNA